MHALLAHAYHLALLPIHLAAWPVWRSLAACLVVALLARVTVGDTARLWVAGIAVLAGWLVLAWPGMSDNWPPTPVARLPGLALIVLAPIVLAGSLPGARGWWAGLRLALVAGLAAWWLRGAPLTGAGIAGCVPVFLGLAAAFPLAGGFARRDAGWGTLAACVALAASLTVTGAAPHWARAALVPAVAALGLLGRPAAMQLLSGMLVATAANALVASDRGRLIPVDVACLVPLLAWVMVSRLAPLLGRHGSAVAAMLAALACVGVAWSSTRTMALG